MSCLSGLCILCVLFVGFVMAGEIYVMFAWSGGYMSCLSGLGVICLVCLGCLSFLPTSYKASVLCTCISMYVHAHVLIKPRDSQGNTTERTAKSGMDGLESNFLACSCPKGI